MTDSKRTIRCIVQCYNPETELPELFGCIVEESYDEYDDGKHFETAANLARQHDLIPGCLDVSPLVKIQQFIFTEEDGPAWLFASYPWLWYVNTYLIDRAYGGPEEGGWWYDTEVPVRQSGDEFPEFPRTEFERRNGFVNERFDAELEQQSFSYRRDAEKFLVERQKWCDAENAQRNSDVSSVRSEGKYIVRLENGPPQYSPAVIPNYC